MGFKISRPDRPAASRAGSTGSTDSGESRGPESVDSGFMKRALQLAAQGRYRVSPNPLVGAVVVRENRVLGEGFHQQVGGPHAEVEALDRVEGSARDATLYVTLEPCSHHGRTPPCVERVLEAGVRRVVCATADPNPRVSGRSLRRLREAGVDVALGVGAREAVELNLPFLKSFVDQRPLVTLKWAMSVDGKIATRTGESQWISSPEGREWALALREEHDAILVGSETAIVDDARLDRRLGLAPGPNVRVVLDRRLRLQSKQRLFDAEGDLLVFTESRDAKRREDLEHRGANIVTMDAVEPATVLVELFERGITSLLVEGGGRILDAFVRANSFDRVAICCAPKLIGGEEAKTPVAGLGIDRLADAATLESLTARAVGPDVVLDATRSGLISRLLEAVSGESSHNGPLR